MDRHPVHAIVLCCITCGFMRLAQDYPGARARAAAHTHVSGHYDVEYAIVETPDRLRLAKAFEQRSQESIHGYVVDAMGDRLPRGFVNEELEATITEVTARR
jgi:hypothetical protein